MQLKLLCATEFALPFFSKRPLAAFFCLLLFRQVKTIKAHFLDADKSRQNYRYS
jgi:hypothetical protein